MNTITKNPIVLFWYYILVNMAPSFYFAMTQPVDGLGKLTILFFPLGLYMLIFSVLKNTGFSLLLTFPLLFLHAFQIVLFYLYGEDGIAVDMFLNVASTNTSEINELLSSLLPSIALVLVLYVPVLVFAIRQWIQKSYLSNIFRRKTQLSATLFLVLALLLSAFSTLKNNDPLIFKNDIYPINAINNLVLAIRKIDKIKHYRETSNLFKFDAKRESSDLSKRQIYVLVVGETGRADNWSLYGYHRETNPCLKRQRNLIVFKDALTQSNTTHKSVSILLSDVKITDYNSIYKRKGIVEAFNETGFTTISLSNQAENGSFIEYFTKSAKVYKTLRTTNKKTGVTQNHYDEELIPLMQKQIQENKGDLFILLHTYGSHFKYMDRYPEQFRKYMPDHISNVSRSEQDRLVNAYDNTILYTDHFLSSTIDALNKTSAKVALLYTSDHGEDLMDDNRNKFLHASPTPTYYQLRIPFIMWFSDSYVADHKNAIQAARINSKKPISSNAVFHTMLNAAQLYSPYLDTTLSLIHKDFKIAPRLYLNDHDIAVPYRKMNLKQMDIEMLEKNGIKN